jgi:hypothetical protein
MEPLESLPPGVRKGLRRLIAFLTLSPSLEDAMRSAEELDLRDLNEREVAYLEGLTVKTIREWRSEGEGRGPDFRNQGGVRYPLKWYLEWRERGRQSATSQGVRRGRRTDLAGPI